MKRTFLYLILFFLLTACAPRQLTVSDAWARPSLAGNNSALYFVIQNPGEDDTLLGVATKVAGTAEMHKTMSVESDHNMDHSMSGSDMGTMPAGEVMTMVKQETVLVLGGEKVSFEPGGLHVMLVGLNSDLAVGDTIEVTFTFEKAGEITLQVPVEEGR